MKNKSIYVLHADVCKALGHPIRIEIIEVLQEDELSFGDILSKIGGLKSTLSQHLTIMTHKGLLAQRKKGINVYYKLSSAKVSKACRLMREVLVENIQRHQVILNQ